METKYTADQIADYFLSKVNIEAGDSISPLKLQKLVYYAQAWNYTLFGIPLFNDKIEAWKHGPAIKKLYSRFEKYSRTSSINIGEEKIQPPILNESSKNLLEEINILYGEHSGAYLEKLTHSEEPWIIARKGLPDYMASSNEISLESMKAFYSKLNEQGKK